MISLLLILSDFAYSYTLILSLLSCLLNTLHLHMVLAHSQAEFLNKRLANPSSVTAMNDPLHSCRLPDRAPACPLVLYKRN